MGSTQDPGRSDAQRFAEVIPRERIAREFGTLNAQSKLFGADLNPDILKKTGTGSSFLPAAVPPLRRLLAMWARLFGNRVSPADLLRHLAVEIHGFKHRDSFLLFARDRIIYDTQIVHGDEPIGELTLFLCAERDRSRGAVAALLHPRTIRYVYIEKVHLREQSSGYASALFRGYETLFHDLGFNQFRLKASLSVGKYYWAKEGFDCRDPGELDRMRDGLRRFVRERELPVRETEIVRLNHAYDIALLRRDLKVPVYRNAEGFYSRRRDEEFGEEHAFPLGKAFLLCSDPWDGYKTIYTNTPRRTGFVYSEAYLAHRTRRGHPESHGRLVRLIKEIRREEIDGGLVFLPPYVPEREMVERIHRGEFLEAFRRSVSEGRSQFATRDCSICGASFDVAMLAAGGVMAGVDAVLNGRVDNVFCAVRPPGHHAGAASAMGFCFINNVAVGAAYARDAYGVGKIFILDWDVHHGNGTQEIFAEDPATYFCSIHEHPTFCYPGTGRRAERGRGAGLGTTLNVPLTPHATDRHLIAAFEEEVVPEIERFGPDLIMVSAGFDAHAADPIADLELTEASYGHMTRKLCELADRHCGGRIVSVLEGGYNGASLASSAIAHLKALQGRS